MARQRRGGFSAPELRGTLGTLLRTTREVLERGARQGRERLDEVLASRRRNDVLAELGEIVLALVRDGEIDLGELPEARDIIAQLDELDARNSSHDRDDDDNHERLTRPSSRHRFDDRGAASRDGTSRDGTSRDGTVTAKTWSPPSRTKTSTNVWRPPNLRDVSPPRAAPSASPSPARGGITFDDDDLADYMNPDDVPKPRSDDES
jgi:hypothetical protein